MLSSLPLLSVSTSRRTLLSGRSSLNGLVGDDVAIKYRLCCHPPITIHKKDATVPCDSFKSNLSINGDAKSQLRVEGGRTSQVGLRVRDGTHKISCFFSFVLSNNSGIMLCTTLFQKANFVFCEI